MRNAGSGCRVYHMPSENLESHSAEPAAPAKSGRKHGTAAAAREAGAMWWREESWPQNLYLKLDVGRFFYRAQRSGSRSFLKLETSDFKIAKRKLAAKMADVSAVREQGASAANANFRLLVGVCRRTAPNLESLRPKGVHAEMLSRPSQPAARALALREIRFVLGRERGP